MAGALTVCLYLTGIGEIQTGISQIACINKRKSHSLMTVAKWVEIHPKGGTSLYRYFYTLKPITKLTGVFLVLSAMKWTGRILCY